MRNQSNLKASILKALSVLILSTSPIACEDTPKEAPKPPATPSIATGEKRPEPPATLVPPVATAAHPPAIGASEIKKEDPIVKVNDDDGDDDAEGAPLTDLLSRARTALAAGETQRALKLSTLAAQKAPRRSSAWNILGRAQLQSGKRKLALASFERAVELNPDNSYAQNNLGLTLIYDRRFSEAVEALEAAVELEPVEGYMWNNLGMAYEHVDRLDDARDAYQKATELENDNARDSLARLQGVKSVVRTAKVDRVLETGESRATTQ